MQKIKLTKVQHDETLALIVSGGKLECSEIHDDDCPSINGGIGCNCKQEYYLTEDYEGFIQKYADDLNNSPEH